tara:strand:- start:33060 stop:34817 length:1758 start_codon:yes stop_codon:yes gene_type:complete
MDFTNKYKSRTDPRQQEPLAFTLQTGVKLSYSCRALDIARIRNLTEAKRTHLTTMPQASSVKTAYSAAEPINIASIDMGSNSFHMVIAQLVHNEIRPIEKIGEKVQLGAGLDDKLMLDEASQQRGLECLQRFAQRLQGIPPSRIQVVGTNALRIARNAQDFVVKAEAILNSPIAIISGREEARLIYLGVAHSLSDDAGRRLVIDIGGGSTEYVIGDRFEPIELESMHMGCVGYRDRFFTNKANEVTATPEQFKAAITEASRELLAIKKRFKKVGWQHCTGSSGSIKAIQQALQENKLSPHAITLPTMLELQKQLMDGGDKPKSYSATLDRLNIRKDRQTIFAAGLAILIAAFQTLKIQEMEFSDGALREGLLYDALGRTQHEDVRERTISSLQARYQIESSHAAAVEATACRMFDQLMAAKATDEALAGYWRDILQWSARVHEIGLAISHTQYHRHGAYLLEHSDLQGFSQRVQHLLSILTRTHRRKLSDDLFADLLPDDRPWVIMLAVVLRLAVIIHHDRSLNEPAALAINMKDNTYHLSFQDDWLAERPLSQADFSAEIAYLQRIKVELIVESSASIVSSSSK